jgi:hypothetical protein
LENNVLEEQERPYLGISQRCDLERYSFDTVCQNTVHAGIRLFTGLITSTKDCIRYIPVHELCKSLSSVVCEILPADHALTGCDTTSSFFGIGKNSMFKALKEPPNQFSDYQTFHLCNHAQEVIQLLALEYVQLTIFLFGTKI